mmetsp:Transcript_29903/g.77192  ORF Transcript_29903/g.77192 Transcript_29903/m.77192 type:complete len:214 (+) Transcript_29903:485-1126(+)
MGRCRFPPRKGKNCWERSPFLSFCFTKTRPNNPRGDGVFFSRWEHLPFPLLSDQQLPWGAHLCGKEAPSRRMFLLRSPSPRTPILFLCLPNRLRQSFLLSPLPTTTTRPCFQNIAWKSSVALAWTREDFFSLPRISAKWSISQRWISCSFSTSWQHMCGSPLKRRMSDVSFRTTNQALESAIGGVTGGGTSLLTKERQTFFFFSLSLSSGCGS